MCRWRAVRYVFNSGRRACGHFSHLPLRVTVIHSARALVSYALFHAGKARYLALPLKELRGGNVGVYTLAR